MTPRDALMPMDNVAFRWGSPPRWRCTGYVACVRVRAVCLALYVPGADRTHGVWVPRSAILGQVRHGEGGWRFDLAPWWRPRGKHDTMALNVCSEKI